MALAVSGTVLAVYDPVEYKDRTAGNAVYECAQIAYDAGYKAVTPPPQNGSRTPGLCHDHHL